MNVDSSMIKKISHRGTVLRVTFNNGAVYVYQGVPKEVYENFKLSGSKGKFFTINIRGKYPFQRLK